MIEIDLETRPAEIECREDDKAKVVDRMKKLSWRKNMGLLMREEEGGSILWQGSRKDAMNRKSCIHCHCGWLEAA